jgi:hypothetical protein
MEVSHSLCLLYRLYPYLIFSFFILCRGCFETIKAMIKGNEKALQDIKSSKFIWKCSYSFQYRNVPVLSLTWSYDSSFLAVAHDNIVSFWNPIKYNDVFYVFLLFF